MEVKLRVNKSLKKQTISQIKQLVKEESLSSVWEYNTKDINPKCKPETLAKELKKMKVVKRVSQGCLEGCYGASTGRYNDGLTISLDHSKGAAFFIDSDGAILLNTEKWLSTFYRRTDLEKLMQKKDMDADALAEHLNYSYRQGDNSYNYSSDLSSDVDFHVLKKSKEDCNHALVVVRIHCGGDIRGNYSLEQVYELSEDDYSDFFSFYVGLYRDGVDTYSQGYTNEPQYHFYKAYDFIRVVDGSIEVKNKETNEVEVFSPDHPINYRG